MRIEEYFQHLQSVIEAAPIIQFSRVTYDKRGAYEGFVRGELILVDGSILHVREYVDVEVDADRLMYVYQYMDATRSLIFR